MSQRLYYENQYLSEFSATVISCEKAKNGFEIVLDKTAFFPEGGGQPGDTGYISDSRVIDTVEKGGEVYHICEKPVEAEKTVDCRLDFEKRFLNMQQHSGEHIFSGIIHSICGYDNVGFHMGDGYVTVDFSGVVSEEELKRAEKLTNEVIFKNVPIQILLPDRDELEKYSYRSKKEIEGQVRLVLIEGADLCACCGTHVAFTGEVGMVKAISMQNHKTGVRITLLIGSLALADYSEKNENIYKISRLFKVKPEEAYTAVQKFYDQTQELRASMFALKKELFSAKCETLSGEFAAMFDNGGTADDARILSDIMAEKVCIAAAFSGSDADGYKYAITSRTADVRPLGKELNSALCGRGGGKPDMVQGSVAATKEQIEAFLEKMGS